MNMKQKTGKLLMAAIAAVLLFTSACGESQEETPPKTPENTLSNGAAPSESEEEGNGTYTETYDPEALFKFGMTPVKDKTTGKYGYKNEAGQWVIEPQFVMANDFQVNKTAFGPHRKQ